MPQPASLTEVVDSLSNIFSGSEKDLPKVFALGVYEGSARYDGTHEDHEVGQMLSALHVFSGYLPRLLEASANPGDLREETKLIRAESGDLSTISEDAYVGERALVPALHEALTINPLVGNNLRDVGRGMINAISTVRSVQGDGTPRILKREYTRIHDYLTQE